VLKSCLGLCMIVAQKGMEQFLIGNFLLGPNTTLFESTDYKMAAQLSDQIGFSSVVLPDTVTFVQLPNIACNEVWFGTGAGFSVAGSASPGSVFLSFGPPSAGATIWIMVPTGGNANNLFMRANSGALTMPFMWRNPRAQSVVMGV
jgi:hypothetical protein